MKRMAKKKAKIRNKTNTPRNTTVTTRSWSIDPFDAGTIRIDMRTADLELLDAESLVAVVDACNGDKILCTPAIAARRSKSGLFGAIATIIGVSMPLVMVPLRFVNGYLEPGSIVRNNDQNILASKNHFCSPNIDVNHKHYIVFQVHGIGIGTTMRRSERGMGIDFRPQRGRGSELMFASYQSIFMLNAQSAEQQIFEFLYDVWHFKMNGKFYL